MGSSATMAHHIPYFDDINDRGEVLLAVKHTESLTGPRLGCLTTGPCLIYNIGTQTIMTPELVSRWRSNQGFRFRG